MIWYYSIATHNSAKNVVARTMFTNTHVKAAWDLLVNCFRRKEFSTTGLSLLTTLLCILPAFTLVVCDIQDIKHEMATDRDGLSKDLVPSFKSSACGASIL